MRKVLLSLVLLVVVIFCLPQNVYGLSYEDIVGQKEIIHDIAEDARDNGLEENHDLIILAKDLWQKADNKLIAGDYKKAELLKFYTDSDTMKLARLMYGEGRGIKSQTQLACIVWTVLNRVDAGYGSISAIVTAKNQYHYLSNAPTVSDYGYDLKWLAEDVLIRWNLEKNGLNSIGRVLPSNYLYFHGNGKVNIFRNHYNHNKATYWNYSLPSPYKN